MLFFLSKSFRRQKSSSGPCNHQIPGIRKERRRDRKDPWGCKTRAFRPLILKPTVRFRLLWDRKQAYRRRAVGKVKIGERNCWRGVEIEISKVKKEEDQEVLSCSFLGKSIPSHLPGFVFYGIWFTVVWRSFADCRKKRGSCWCRIWCGWLMWDIWISWSVFWIEVRMSKLRIDKNKCLQRSWTGKMAYGILNSNWSWRFKHGFW